MIENVKKKRKIKIDFNKSQFDKIQKNKDCAVPYTVHTIKAES